MASEVRTINPVNCCFLNELWKLMFTISVLAGSEKIAPVVFAGGGELCYSCGGFLEVRVANLFLSGG